MSGVGRLEKNGATETIDLELSQFQHLFNRERKAFKNFSKMVINTLFEASPLLLN